MSKLPDDKRILAAFYRDLAKTQREWQNNDDDLRLEHTVYDARAAEIEASAPRYVVCGSDGEEDTAGDFVLDTKNGKVFSMWNDDAAVSLAEHLNSQEGGGKAA